MSKRLRILTVLAIALFVSASLSQGTSARTPPEDQDHQRRVVFHQEDGIKANSTLILNGTSTQPLQSSSWRLVNTTNFDQHDILVEGTHLSSVVPSGETQWRWTLVLDVEDIHCTCRVEVLANNQSLHPAVITVYLGDSDHRPVLKPFSNPFYLLTTEHLVVEMDAVTPSQSLNGSALSTTLCEAPWGVCLAEKVPFELTYSVTDSINIEFNSSEIALPDGFWMFHIELEDRTLKVSNTVSFVLQLDRQAPVITLSNSHNSEAIGLMENDMIPGEFDGTSVVMEHSVVLFSADVSDGYAGESEVLTWSKISPSGEQSTFSKASFVSPSSVSFTPDEAGKWTVELLVRDSAGHLVRASSSIMVENVPPQAHLFLDGLTVNDGDMVMFPQGTDWILNASQSLDTENDLFGLNYRWYVGEELVKNGGATLNSGDFNKTGSHTLRLLVTDDDGAQSELSFTISVPSDSAAGSEGMLGANPFTLGLVVVFSLSMFLLVRMGRSSPPESLPKWHSKEE